MYKTIQTERLLLRPLGINDLYSVHKYAGDIENTRYMIFLPNESLDDSRNFLLNVTSEWAKEDPDSYEFAVILEGEHIGTVSIYLEDDKSTAELGWIICKDYWNHGYATEAAMAVKEFAVKELKVKTIMAHCDGDNRASQRIMDNIGLTLEDTSGNRKNKSALKPSKEYLYSLKLV